LAIFFAVLVLGSGFVELLIYRTHKPLGQDVGLVFALMWTPGLASIVARLVCREGFGDVSFRFGGVRTLRAIGVAALFPLIVGLVAYGIAWGTGLADFASKPVRGWGVEDPVARFAIRAVINGTLGTIFGSVFALGEELGWRGYLVTRLIDAGVKRPALASGVIWGAWHVPMILSGQYAAGPLGWISALIFLADIVPSAYLYAYLRLTSGSLWPTVAAHAIWNAVIQAVFDSSTAGSSLWVGESGILVAGVSIALAAFIVTRHPWTMRRTPSDAGERQLRAVEL
jgi:membrane protease YdiL (CAAX protease family)